MPEFTLGDFRRAMRAGKWAWPGGYPRYFVLADGDALSFEGARQERRRIIEALVSDERHNDWRIIAVDINWEDATLACCQLGDRIPSAYAEDRDLAQAARGDTP